MTSCQNFEVDHKKWNQFSPSEREVLMSLAREFDRELIIHKNGVAVEKYVIMPKFSYTNDEPPWKKKKS